MDSTMPDDTNSLAMSRTTRDLLVNILDHIRRSDLPVGYHLTELQLSDAFKVSRSPVRAALKVLADEGIVTCEANRGHYLSVEGAARAEALLARLKATKATLYDRITFDRMRRRLPEQFTEAEIMRRYDASRVQVVKTLSKMLRDGLIDRSMGNGWTFRAVLDSDELYVASYRFRLLIEPAGLLEPTFNLDSEALARSRAQHDVLRRHAEKGELNTREIFQINSEFHEMLARCSGNAFILQAVEQQNRLRMICEYFTHYDAEQIARLHDEHCAIMDALAADDRESAAALLRQHLNNASKRGPVLLPESKGE